MSYKALYRTYRPQVFGDVKGQEVVVQTLQNAIKNNKISHAYLFSGPRGTGKTSIARIFAKALNCSNLNESEPCDTCVSCNEISQGINPDVIEIDAASNNGVDEIRDIKEKVKFLPSGSKYKVYIIDEVHMLSGGAFNALLKTLEEPPKHAIFILATTEPQKLPATIISRCQRYEFKSLSIKEINERLKRICDLENVNVTEEALNAISEASEGAMRDALSILDQAISYGSKDIDVEDINGVTGSLSFERIIALANSIEKKEIHQTLAVFNNLISSGKEVSKIINSLLVFYRDVLLFKSVGNEGLTKYIFSKDQFKEFSDNILLSKIMYFIDVLCDVQSKVKYSTTPNIFLEIALIKMCNVSVEELDVMKRLTELENKFNTTGINNVASTYEVNPINDEKINTLELRVNQIINELNRLEIRKQISRIDELSNVVNNISNIKTNDDYSEYKSDINYLKAKVEELELFIDKDSDQGNNTCNTELIDKVKMLEETMKNISFTNANDVSINASQYDQRLSQIEDNIKNQNNENINDIKENIESINEDLNQIKNKLIELENARFDVVNENQDLREISEKIMFLEKRLYQVISGELAQTKAAKKEIKKNKGQIMLFGDELLSINDFEVAKEKYDFGDIEKEQEEIIESKQIINQISEEVDEEIIDTINNNVDEDVIDDTNDNIVDVEMFNVDAELSVEIKSTEPIEETSNGLFENDNFIEKEQEEPVKYYDEVNEQDVYSKQNSTLVISKKQDDENTDSLEKHIIALETETNKQNDINLTQIEESKEEVIVEKPQEKDFDKFSKYDVKDIEQILHDSRSIEARNDKARIEQVWKNMTRGARPEHLSIIETLQDGKIVVVGNKEFIIVFSNVSMCNIVMRKKFKDVALRIIYNLLGDKYNYIALPIDVWSEKSIEYKQQYQIGIKFPELKPMVIPGLDIKEDVETEKEKTINQTIELFGEGNVEIE